MFNKFATFFVVFALLLSVNLFAQSLNRQTQEDARKIGEKVELPLQTVEFDHSEAVLFDNGPLVSLPGGGCSGGDASILDGTLGHTTFGYGCQQTAGNSMADDFTSSAAWNIDSIKFFTYQTSATSVTINGVFVQIYNGNPSSGGTVVWGDLTTNRLIRAGFSNIYRAQNTTPTDCARRIQEAVANIGINLPAGQYWVEVTLTGTSSSGPWVPPVTIAGTGVTGDAWQKTTAGWAQILNGTDLQGMPFIVYGTAGAACPVQPATNPSPVNGATNVSINPGSASWTNGTGTTLVEFWFGPVGSMVKLYDGAPVTSYAIPGPLNYMTTYNWKVVCKDNTCSAVTTTWSFTTEQNPNVIFSDPFTDMNNWTAVGPSGTGNWSTQATANAGGTAPELRFAWTPSFTGESYLRSNVIPVPGGSVQLQLSYKWFLDWYADPSGTIGVYGTYDGGATRFPIHVDVDPTGNIGPSTVLFDWTGPASASNLQLECYYNGYSFNIDYIYWDDMLLTYVVPVELTSFAASVVDKNVNLNWSTATETNNSGFQVERNSGSGFESVGFVAGHGTTVQIQNYSFVDQNVNPGSYTYRLKQIDFNGNHEYSKEVEVEVGAPKEFSLSQNYPNPFNPSTKISFNLAVDSKVTLRIFDVLGQEITTLVNRQMNAGKHDIQLNATGLNSGVYFYKLEADGINGQNFSSIKKMILTK